MHDHSVCPSLLAQPRVHDSADLYMTADVCDATYISWGSNFAAVTVRSVVTRLAGCYEKYLFVFGLMEVFLSFGKCQWGGFVCLGVERGISRGLDVTLGCDVTVVFKEA